MQNTIKKLTSNFYFIAKPMVKRFNNLGGSSENNVHRIVIGSDGKYYYTNTHYGKPDDSSIKGIPFYEAGELPKETIEKVFKKDNK